MPKESPTERFTLSYRPGGGRWKILGHFGSMQELLQRVNMRGDFWIQENTDGDVQELRGFDQVGQAQPEPTGGTH